MQIFKLHGSRLQTASLQFLKKWWQGIVETPESNVAGQAKHTAEDSSTISQSKHDLHLFSASPRPPRPRPPRVPPRPSSLSTTELESNNISDPETFFTPNGKVREQKINEDNIINFIYFCRNIVSQYFLQVCLSLISVKHLLGLRSVKIW